jgi:hypothetical protein
MFTVVWSGRVAVNVAAAGVAGRPFSSVTARVPRYTWPTSIGTAHPFPVAVACQTGPPPTRPDDDDDPGRAPATGTETARAEP